MRFSMQTIWFIVFLVILPLEISSAQFPESVVCQFERIATAELDSSGNIITGSETSSGELVISNLNSDSPLGSGDIGTVKLQVLRKSKTTIWLAEMNANEVASLTTLFFKTGIVMYTKHETLHTLLDGDKPFGFVEIGRFRIIK
ncbi:MAG: hypothetical protein ABSC53_03405 [Bacteroidota bacterium]